MVSDLNDKFCSSIDFVIRAPYAAYKFVAAFPPIYIKGLFVVGVTTAGLLGAKHAANSYFVKHNIPNKIQRQLTDISLVSAHTTICSLWSYGNYLTFYGLEKITEDCFSKSSFYLLCYSMGYILFSIVDGFKNGYVNMTKFTVTQHMVHLLYGLCTLTSNNVGLFNMLTLMRLQNLFTTAYLMLNFNKRVKYVTGSLVLATSMWLTGIFFYIMHELLMDKNIKTALYFYFGLLSHFYTPILDEKTVVFGKL